MCTKGSEIPERQKQKERMGTQPPQPKRERAKKKNTRIQLHKAYPIKIY